jgi:hypothetical protein
MVDAYSPLLLVNLALSEQDQRKAEIIQLAAKKFGLGSWEIMKEYHLVKQCTGKP